LLCIQAKSFALPPPPNNNILTAKSDSLKTALDSSQQSVSRGRGHPHAWTRGRALTRTSRGRSSAGSWRTREFYAFNLLALRSWIEICFAFRLCLPSVLQLRPHLWRLGGELQLQRRGVGLGGAAETSGYCSGDPSTRCSSSASFVRAPPHLPPTPGLGELLQLQPSLCNFTNRQKCPCVATGTYSL
jgi:hypothetical protein